MSMLKFPGDAGQYSELNDGRDSSEETPEVIEQDLTDQSIQVGSGCDWTGSGVEPQWNNPKSTKAYDHIERHHGPKLKPRHFQGRAASKNQPQGQWLNSQDWVKAEQAIPKYPGRYIINFKRPIGKVHYLDGKIIENVTHAFIRRNLDGTFKCAYPILNDTTLSSLERSDQNE
ncbi:hypothetical protein [Phormidium nigroviride]